jgi:hypothetical protein
MTYTDRLVKLIHRCKEEGDNFLAVCARMRERRQFEAAAASWARYAHYERRAIRLTNHYLGLIHSPPGGANRSETTPLVPQASSGGKE